MNLNTLKSFAPEVRRQLIEAVGRKLDYVLTADTADLRAMQAQRESLREQAELDRKGMIERVAYTWFNRLAALRFLDARGWHPFRARVITPTTAEETQPELLKLMRSGALPAELTPFTDVARLNDLLDGRIPSADAQGEVYRHLVLASCRYYHDLLPNLFEELDDETELLLPDDLLTEHAVVHGFRTEISDEDCGDDQRANVEILGWLYQFYISERKAQVMARKSVVPTEDIPAVTQLFTPHWIVRYLVENSLGRLWLLNRPQSKLRDHMPYYIEGEAETDFLRITKPEEIRLVDPACGSGHMLTYAFDLLSLIYEEEGYAPTEIPALILRHNLYGLDICPRAAQLAELALVFKAREKSRRFFQPEQIVRPNIIELRDIRFAENELRDYIRVLGLGDLFNPPMLNLLHQFEDAKNFGSLLQPCLDERAIASARRTIEGEDLGGHPSMRETHLKVLRVIEQAEALTPRYHVTVANPPYMGRSGMNVMLRGFVDEQFPESKHNLFSVFMERLGMLAMKSGAVAMVTMQNWMFLSRFSAFRTSLLRNWHLDSLLHLGARAFDSISGEVVQTAAFTFWTKPSKNIPAHFFRLVDGDDSEFKEQNFLSAVQNQASPLRFDVVTERFRVIQEEPLCYWATDREFFSFEKNPVLGKQLIAREGMATGSNGLFLRLWHEVSLNRAGFGCSTITDSVKSGRRWFPYNKGGGELRWFGNNDYLVNWQNDGAEIRCFADEKTGRIRSHNYNGEYSFREGVSWSSIGSGRLSARYSPVGFLFDAKGTTAFTASKLLFFTGLLNSLVGTRFISLLSPTLDFKLGHILSVPVVESQDTVSSVAGLVEQTIALARADWNNFEASWDFRNLPLLRTGVKGAKLEASWRNWEAQSKATIRRIQELETENNRIFISLYGLEGELQPEVPEEQNTLTRAEARSDMAAFLSYAVGCMMGRYSLDQPGLILADAGESLREYLEKVQRPQDQLTFAPDEDGIIPVLDGEWFEDDVVARTRDFLRATFGDATLEANLRFIEESLGKDLRKYFVTDYYKDHLKTYKKRPIYWLFQSPKKHFRALVYLHRYTKDTANLVLDDYLREFLHKLHSRLEHLERVLASESTPARELTAARKEVDKIRAAIRDCEDYEREILLPLAQQRIELDLDDGVKVNYLKLKSDLGPALVVIPGLAAKEE